MRVLTWTLFARQPPLLRFHKALAPALQKLRRLQVLQAEERQADSWRWALGRASAAAPLGSIGRCEQRRIDRCLCTLQVEHRHRPPRLSRSDTGNVFGSLAVELLYRRGFPMFACTVQPHLCIASDWLTRPAKRNKNAYFDACTTDIGHTLSIGTPRG